MPKRPAYLSHSREDWRFFAEACARILCAWAALKILNFERVTASLKSGGRVARPADQVMIRRVRWAVEAAARHLPLSLTCLPQSLAASWMLQARGFAPRMIYGVAPLRPDGFEAHAWVELNGIPVVGHRAAPRFATLTSFPRNTAS
jgi:hypothetical protein